MTEDEVKLLSDYVRDNCGLLVHAPQEILFQRRVKKRVDANKLTTARDYYHFLRFDAKGAEEMRELINILTVNETYFFRETPQMEMFTRDLLPILKERNYEKKTIRIWSAACSNGSEPYSLAILLLESDLFSGLGWKIEIAGTDINSEMIRSARKGIFTASSFRVTPPNILTKYFTEVEKGCWEINDRVKKMVSFSQINFFNSSQMRLMRGFDVIFCRNVLIYFDDAGKRRVVEMLYDSLGPLGYLVIGQSESLFKITTIYDIFPTENTVLYQKQDPAGVTAGSENIGLAR
jgi:chemotaxis protein methyltransferase CheR